MPVLPYELTNLLWLLVPLVLPKALSFVSKCIRNYGGKGRGKRQRGRTAAATTTSPVTQPVHRGYKVERWRYLPVFFLACWAVYSLVTYRNAHDLFARLDLPLTAPQKSIEASLRFFSLQKTYSHLLPYLTSLDARLLYVHYGGDTFFEFYKDGGLFGANLAGAQAQKDMLAFQAVRTVRGYLLAGILLAVANKRFRHFAVMGAILGAAVEIYISATTDMRIDHKGFALRHLADDLRLYRYAGVLIACIATYLAPQAGASTAVSKEEANLTEMLRSLLQRQDLLQTRIRALEVLQNLGDADDTETERKSTGTEAVSEAKKQKQALQKWLGALLSGDAEGPELASSTSQRDFAVASLGIESPSLPPIPKREPSSTDTPSTITFSPPSGSSDTLRHHRGKQDAAPGTGEENSQETFSSPLDSSPALSTTSSRESSRIETPTPSSNIPVNGDLFAPMVPLLERMERTRISDPPTKVPPRAEEEPQKMMPPTSTSPDTDVYGIVEQRNATVPSEDPPAAASELQSPLELPAQLQPSAGPSDPGVAQESRPSENIAVTTAKELQETLNTAQDLPQSEGPLLSEDITSTDIAQSIHESDLASTGGTISRPAAEPVVGTASGSDEYWTIVGDALPSSVPEQSPKEEPDSDLQAALQAIAAMQAEEFRQSQSSPAQADAAPSADEAFTSTPPSDRSKTGSPRKALQAVSFNIPGFGSSGRQTQSASSSPMKAGNARRQSGQGIENDEWTTVIKKKNRWRLST